MDRLQREEQSLLKAQTSPEWYQRLQLLRQALHQNWHGEIVASRWGSLALVVLHPVVDDAYTARPSSVSRLQREGNISVRKEMVWKLTCFKIERPTTNIRDILADW